MNDNELVPAHDLLSPSSADRWIACPASLKESVGRDRPDTVYTAAGTRAHELAAAAVLHLIDPSYPFAVYDDAEQAEACEAYVDYIRKSVHSFAIAGYQRVVFAVETRIRSESIEDFGGTVDFFAVWRREDELIGQVVDFKFGSGVPVDAHRNSQLIAYASLLSERYPGVKEWRCAIVQPRCQYDGHAVREAVVDPIDVTIFGAVASRAKQLTDVYQTGDHCRWCPAKAFCSAFHERVVETAMAEMLDDTENRDFETQLERWRFLLEHADALRAMLNDVSGHILRALEQGREVPGWKAVPSQGHRRWKVDESVVLRKLRSIFGVPKKAATETCLRSPAQIEKLIKSRGGDPSALEVLIERPDRGCRVVPDNEKREPRSIADQIKEFEQHG